MYLNRSFQSNIGNIGREKGGGILNLFQTGVIQFRESYKEHLRKKKRERERENGSDTYYK